MRGQIAEAGNETLLMTVAEAADTLRLGLTTTWAMVHRGEIPTVRLGRNVRVVRAGLRDVVLARARTWPRQEEESK